MRVLRAALAVGALTLSVPVLAQGSRYGLDRTRVDRSRVERPRVERGRAEPGRVEHGSETRRVDPRTSRRDDGRNVTPGDRRNQPDNRFDRSDNRPVRRDDRYDRRDDRYDRRDDYRVYDRDRRGRDVVVIGSWFRGLGHAYGLRDRIYQRDRYDFRPGLYLSSVIFARLDMLPFDLVLRLGPLPWYYERRMYGRTVLIIDTRSRMIVDVYDVDW
ncbi:MAG: hypothetical protein AAB224_02400 [Gemmatimonadota bacterium]